MKRVLRESIRFEFHPEIQGKGRYVALNTVTYYSLRYGKSVTVHAGYKSDGASGPAEDIISESWWFHDVLCDTYRWDDGSVCTRWQSSAVIYDILRDEGRWIRAIRWRFWTFFAGLGRSDWL